MAGFEKRAKRYPTDLTDEEWRFIEPFLPPVPKRERKPTTDLREVLDALRDPARTGGGWRMLPNDLPPWQTVHWWFRRFVRRLLFRTIHDVALMLDRDRETRKRKIEIWFQDEARIGQKNGIVRHWPGAARGRSSPLASATRVPICSARSDRPGAWRPGSRCPSPTRIRFGILMSALLSLSLNEAAYLSETIRGGFNGIAKGQREAAKALGLSRWHTLRLVLLPQVLRLIIPPLGNSLNGLLKAT